MPNIPNAIRALTCDDIRVQDMSNWRDVTQDRPLLDRSISWELRRIDQTLGVNGSSVLRAIAHSIDEALLALVEDGPVAEVGRSSG
jgi:hypothetical protein